MGVVLVRVIVIEVLVRVIVIELTRNLTVRDFSRTITSTAALSTSTTPEPCRFERSWQTVLRLPLPVRCAPAKARPFRHPRSRH